ncbi:MAG: hypothetical protein PHX80_04190 [Candidatus Nanoarchaeia archaeon]|nr:hypothetical protein [Candidatus Nanoarchaeia archaeon]
MTNLKRFLFVAGLVLFFYVGLSFSVYGQATTTQEQLTQGNYMILIQSMQARAQSFQQTSQNLKNALETRKVQDQALKINLENLSQQAESYRIQSETLASQVTQLLSQAEDLRQSLALSLQSNRELQEQIAKLNDSLTSLQRDLSDLAKTFSDYKDISNKKIANLERARDIWGTVAVIGWGGFISVVVYLFLK